MKQNDKRTRKERRLHARRLRSVSPYQAMTPYIMPNRNDALVNFTDTLDITETERFIHEKRREGMRGLGMLHIFIAGYTRAVSQCPQLNRFICGQQIYARDEIEIVMTVKKEMKIDGEETSIKLLLDPSSTLTEIFAKLKTAVDEVRKGESNDTDEIAGKLMKLPRFLLRFFMCIMRFMDYHGLLPRVLLEASPFHGSMIVTDVGSLGIPPVFHHIYNFGNLPMFVSFGTKYRKMVPNRYGEMEERCFIDYCVVIDERICDGSAYAKGVRVMRQSIKRPEMLLEKPEEIKKDMQED